MGVWAKYNPWFNAGMAILGILVGLALGCIIASIAILSHLHLITKHTNWEAAPHVMMGILNQSDYYLKRFLAITALVTVGSVGLIFAALENNQNIFGQARFATGADVAKAKLFENQGAIIGQWNGKWLRAEPEDNVMCNAPPRSGKGVGFVIPNLLLIDYSIVCLDMRGENFANSAAYRQKELGHEIFVLDPLNPDGKTNCYNPLSYIDRKNPNQVIEELQRIAIQLFPHPLQGNPFFTESARDGFTGIGSLLAAEEKQDFTIANIFTILAGDARKVLKIKVEELETEIANGTYRISAGAIDLIKAFASHGDETFMNIRSTIQSKLGLYALPRIVMATRKSDFDLRDLRSKKVTIYLCSSPSDLDVLAPLYNLMFQQIVSLNSRHEFKRTKWTWDDRFVEIDKRLSKADINWRNWLSEAWAAWKGKYREYERNSLRCLLILDEFKRLGKMDVLADAMSYMGGFGISICPVIQANSQLQEVYGAYGANTILTCCQTNMILRPNTQSEAENISKQLGDNGVTQRNLSHTRFGLMGGSGNGSLGSTNESLVRRPLLYPKEVSEMPRRKGLIFKAGQPAVLYNRIEFFKNADLRKKAALGGVNIAVQNLDDYYKYVGTQRYGLVPEDKIEMEFDNKEKIIKKFEEIDKGEGDYSPLNLEKSLHNLKGKVSDFDASAYRRELEAQMA